MDCAGVPAGENMLVEPWPKLATMCAALADHARRTNMSFQPIAGCNDAVIPTLEDGLEEDSSTSQSVLCACGFNGCEASSCTTRDYRNDVTAML
jgi:hypothetical protein